MVTRRLAPLVVAAALVLAPAALDACQVMCALDVAAAAPAPAHHACHDAAAPQSTRDGGVRGVPHACAHADGLPAASGMPLQPALAAPAGLPVVVWGPPAAGLVRCAPVAASVSPPRTVNAGQLRV